MAHIQVELGDILEYVEGVRPIKEGEEIFKAGFIILCGVDVENPLIVKALCLQTAGLTALPHEITIRFGEDKWNCHCTCKAGNSKCCKHIVATLIYINRFPDLELVSCTDLQQKWGKEKKGLEETLKITPLINFPSVPPKKYCGLPTTEVDSRNFELLSVGNSKSALTTFLERAEVETESAQRGTIVGCEDVYLSLLAMQAEKNNFLQNLYVQIGPENKYFKNMNMCCKNEIENLKKLDFVEAASLRQGSSEWHNVRKLRITGSTCYSIFTYSLDNWEKLAVRLFFPKGFINKYIRHGIKYEKEALGAFRKCNPGCHVMTPGFIISKLFCWLGVSPDGIIFEGKEPKQLLEIKCPYIGKDNSTEMFSDNCDYLTEVEGQITLKKKHAYYGQIMLSMAILNLPETRLILYSSHSENYLEILIKFDQRFASDLIEKITQNYFKHLLHFYCLHK